VRIGKKCGISLEFVIYLATTAAAGPAAPAIATQAAGRPILEISECSIRGASALGFNVRVIMVLYPFILSSFHGSI